MINHIAYDLQRENKFSCFGFVMSSPVPSKCLNYYCFSGNIIFPYRVAHLQRTPVVTDCTFGKWQRQMYHFAISHREFRNNQITTPAFILDNCLSFTNPPRFKRSPLPPSSPSFKGPFYLRTLIMSRFSILMAFYEFAFHIIFHTGC